MITAETAILWTERFVSISILIQTLEFFRIEKSYSDNGIWQWKILRKEFEIFPRWILKIFDWLLSYQGFLKVLVIRLVASLVLWFFPHPVILVLLLLTTLLICLRWRGVFNGGSDYMTVATLLGLIAADSFANQPRWQLAGLGYIAIQLCLSYFLAGWAKLRNREWHGGWALQKILQAQGSPAAQKLSQSKPLMFLSTWAILIFELIFPLALISHQAVLIFIFLGILFHLANVAIFGLNRFFWAWLATYPALYYCSLQFL